jgi:predicted NAD/FAD-binding protein
MRIAIVGSGISGLGAARALADRHDVDLYEAAPSPGGHTHTIDVGGVSVDTGFIIYNTRTYPRFSRLVAELGVASRETDMSFSSACAACEVEFGSAGVRSLFAQPGSWARPSRWRLYGGILHFFRTAQRDLADRTLDLTALTLDEYLAWRRISPAAARHFIVPMAAAIWSTSPRDMGAFPAATFLCFFANHGMLGWGGSSSFAGRGGEASRWLTGAPRWRTLVGGSRSYVTALLARLGARVHLRAPVAHVERAPGGVTLHLPDGPRRFDRVILATHSDTALRLLDPTEAEARVLGAIRYTQNDTYLHTDTRFLPAARAAWSAWNHRVADCRQTGAALEASYWMNRLQGLGGRTEYIVTLNPSRPIPERHVLRRIAYAHPLYDLAAIHAQAELPALQGMGGVYFAGAYHGYGFHEDGLRAGEDAAARLERDAALRAAA